MTTKPDSRNSQWRDRSSTSFHSSRQIPSSAPSFAKALRQPFLLIATVTLIAVISFSMMSANLFAAHNVIHILSDDVSASAADYAALRKQHCQVSAQQYQPGDTVVLIPFAAQPEVTLDTTLSNTLSLLGRCQQEETLSADISRIWGTSLILGLKRIQTVFVDKRGLGKTDPIVVTITLQATEPGKGQPDPRNYAAIRESIENIVKNRGVVAIIGPTGALQNDLETHLKGLSNQRVCPKNSASECIEWAFQVGRTL